MARHQTDVIFDQLIQLKEWVTEKFGNEIQNRKLSEKLAEDILKQTNIKINYLTLMRVFGLIKSGSMPSTLTLDTLVMYCGFNDWHSYINRPLFSSSTNQKPLYLWDHLLKKAEPITNISLSGIINKSGLNF